MADIPPTLLPVVRRMGKFMSEYENGSDAHRQALKLDGLRAASSSLHQLAACLLRYHVPRFVLRLRPCDFYGVAAHRRG